jgi:ADP-heptose:LPS heptosyltransferase
VFGADADRTITRYVAGSHAADLGGKTDLLQLAAALATCRVLVTNDTGPMHLAAALGTAVVALHGPGAPREVGPRGAGHHVLWHGELPCTPCRLAACPRRGPGTLLPHAEQECLELIRTDDVAAAVMEVIDREPTGPPRD